MRFHEDWSNGKCKNQWLAYQKNWGKENNGCVPEVIHIEKDIVDGKRKKVVVITTQGNLTRSTINGVKTVDEGYEKVNSSHKVGGVITTLNNFASGSYEIIMKIGHTSDNQIPAGLSPFIMLFHYEEHEAGPNNPRGEKLNPFDPIYQPRFKEKNRNGLYFSTVNIEIDAPELGRNGNFEVGSYNTYISTGAEGATIEQIQFPSSILDGKYHTYRLDWHTTLLPTMLRDDQVKPLGAYYYAYDSPTSPIQGFPVIKKADNKWYALVGSSVVYYLDGKKIGTNTKNIPAVAARLAIGGWFPSWAGTPNWSETKIYISEITITPYHEKGDIFYQPESFGMKGLVPFLGY